MFIKGKSTEGASEYIDFRALTYCRLSYHFYRSCSSRNCVCRYEQINCDLVRYFEQDYE